MMRDLPGYAMEMIVDMAKIRVTMGHKTLHTYNHFFVPHAILITV
jgi:hypothetical protein